MFALIMNNKVVDISQEIFATTRDMIWIECPDSVKITWHYIDGEFKEDIGTVTKKKEDLRAQLISVRRGYLQQNDWKVLRFVDDGTPYDEVRAKRILARQEINEIEVATTLAALNAFELNFV